MTGVSILDGDYVLMEHRDPKPGDIVAALVDNETTIKTCIILLNPVPGECGGQSRTPPEG